MIIQVPKILEAEQMAIHMSNNESDSQLTWVQTRNMPLTHKVISETLRMASIISFTFIEVVADVEYKGYLILKGQKNPPKPNTFIPFGSGVHAYPGNELAKLEMLVMIHQLFTKFRRCFVTQRSYENGI
ncbi:hypothetical protein POM88_001064 [Heracleum sosnowskyi]|uniref:Uncharacterized protein n=1 Tax=Heracleum sosnowskyi TaxID=360622 RepID=A0AAD8JDC6_9APIA|nr:hypothetical protein POM88_001064 [Heracleum sosnowskyi]